MIQMNQNQVAYKYIKIKDSLKTFVKKKRTKLRIFQRNGILLRNKIVVRISRKDYEFKICFLIIGDRGRKCLRYFRCQQNHK